MNWCKKIQNLNDIPKSKYIGYLWQSDKEAPIFIQEIDSKKYETDGVPNNPFIQEAYLFDKEKNTIFCSRDRFGIKPFYYYKDDTNFIFSSEIKSIDIKKTIKNQNSVLRNY